MNFNKRDMSMKMAAVFQFGSKYISMGAQVVITMVLARLIAPADFGLVAIVCVFTGFFSLFSDMGISVAIIQYPDLTEKDYGALFGFSTLLAVGLSASYCCISPLVAAFYGDARLIPLCCAASPQLLFSTLNMVPSGLMLKERRFDAIGIRLVCATVVSGIVAVGLAFAGAGCYALVVQSGLSAFIVLSWNLAARGVRCVSLRFKDPLKRVFSYSAYLFGFCLIDYFSRNLGNMLIGRFMGSVQLGYYDKAYKLTGYPVSAFSSVVSSVIQPYMAEQRDKPDAIFNCFMRIEKSLSLVGVGVAVVFMSSCSEIIQVCFGPGWESAIPVFAVLGVSVYFQMMGYPSGAFFQSLGRTDYMFWVGFINTCITIVGLCAGLTGGSILSVSCGIALAYCLHMLSIAYFLIHRGFGQGYRCLKAFIPEMCVGLVAAVIVCLVFSYVDLPLLAALVAKILLAVGLLLLGYKATGQLGYLKEIVAR